MRSHGKAEYLTCKVISRVRTENLCEGGTIEPIGKAVIGVDRPHHRYHMDLVVMGMEMMTMKVRVMMDRMTGHHLEIIAVTLHNHHGVMGRVVIMVEVMEETAEMMGMIASQRMIGMSTDIVHIIIGPITDVMVIVRPQTAMRTGKGFRSQTRRRVSCGSLWKSTRRPALRK